MRFGLDHPVVFMAVCQRVLAGYSEAVRYKIARHARREGFTHEQARAFLADHVSNRCRSSDEPGITLDDALWKVDHELARARTHTSPPKGERLVATARQSKRRRK